MPTFTSDFAILDVKRGRATMRRFVEDRKLVPVTITGYVDAVHSRDDGTSQEFSITVTDLVVGEPTAGDD
jgi:hypothetical protein